MTGARSVAAARLLIQAAICLIRSESDAARRSRSLTSGKSGIGPHRVAETVRLVWGH
jgi:hypothetical protein